MKKALFTLFISFSLTTFSQTNTIPTNGDVGIGTMNPSSKLDVNGNVKIDSNEYSNLKVLVLSNDGKQQDFFTMNRKSYTLEITNYKNGVYFLKFYLGEDLIETKKMLKL